MTLSFRVGMCCYTCLSYVRPGLARCPRTPMSCVKLSSVIAVFRPVGLYPSTSNRLRKSKLKTTAGFQSRRVPMLPTVRWSLHA
ncbi:UNVERIFIED_CONTAM: hypothetical protein GTU68_025835 [Idotea baltica]|nr:hypothetical protein [Idotea baltica]